MKKVLALITSLILLNFVAFSQCDVYIEPGTIEVIDNGEGVQFTFDVTNNSPVDYEGGTLKMYWSLNSAAPIWDFDFTQNTTADPIAPGETRSMKTPWFDIPNLPSWFPDDPNSSQPWMESQEWPFYGLSFPFQGSWSPMILKLDGCGNDMDGDNVWDNVVYDSNGDFYYGPFNSDCPNANMDQFCDCEIDFLDFNHYTYEATIQVNGWQNCATPLNNGLTGDIDGINSVVFGIHIPGWDYGWGCTSPDIHPGWTFMLFSNLNIDEQQTITLDIGGGSSASTDCWIEILEDVNLPCREIVLWQINYSQTAYVVDFPEYGWATYELLSSSAAKYPDIDLSNNKISYCNTPNAYPPSNGLDVTCVDNEPFWTYDVRVFNNGLDTLFTYCVEIPELGYDECFDGYVQALYWIPPNQGQYLDEITIPTEITEFTVNVYNAGDELDEFFFDNSIVVTINSEANDICEVNGCTDPEALNYDPLANEDDGSCQYSVDIGIDSLTYLLGGCNGEPLYWIPQVNLTNYGNEEITEFCLTFDILSDGLPEDTLCLDQISLLPGESVLVEFTENLSGGDFPVVVSIKAIDVNGENEFSFFYFGDDDFLYNNTSVHMFQMWCYDCTDPEASNYNEFATDEQDPSNCEYVGCTDPEALNFDPEANEDDGSCEYFGCMDSSAVNYDPGATIDDGSCEYEGCTDPDASNFDPIATIDDGSCVYLIYGCTDPQAANYTPEANTDDGSCEYEGCTDPAAFNFDSTATIDDGSCEYEGCTDPAAFNFDSTATIDDGSCEYLGCTDSSAVNYDPTATIEDGSCDYEGCTDLQAINYDQEATIDDGSCIYPSPFDPCDDLPIYAPNTFTPNNDGINDAWYIVTDQDCWREWKVLVFNRWGEKIWESDNSNDKWEGDVNGGSHYAQDGVYFYTITALPSHSSEAKQISGHITLLR